MLRLLSEAGRSFLRGFAGSLVILLPGVLVAPNLNNAYGLGIAALVASLAAGLKSLQVLVPQFTFKSLLPARARSYGNIVDSFVRAFVAALLVFWVGMLNSPDFSFSKSALIALLVGGVTAGFRAVQGLLTKGDVPAPASGVDTPAVPPASAK